jgi:hypothetical protein
MLRFWNNPFRRPGLRPGMPRDSRAPFRNPQFASFLAQSNRKRLDTDFQDAVLRGRKFMRQLMVLLLGGGLAWVLVESARALTVF